MQVLYGERRPKDVLSVATFSVATRRSDEMNTPCQVVLSLGLLGVGLTAVVFFFKGFMLEANLAWTCKVYNGLANGTCRSFRKQ